MAEINFRVAHLHHNNSLSDTRLTEVFYKGKRHIICDDEITTAIQNIVRAPVPEVGFTKTDVSVRYLHVGGSMELLLAWVDTNTTQLVGR